MSDAYPFDPDVRDHVGRLLYELLPSLYRVRDEDSGELRRFLQVLAAPLAELRQNVEELHGDLFIDTCNDWIIPYLADMVGVELIFPDAASNRRDVRGAVSWRRRKGTRGALEEMASDLSGQMVVTHEGWKRLLLSQDLNLLRAERVVTDVRRTTLAEGATGPLDGAYHVLDARDISASTGRYHPEHVVHWLHPTRLFPVREGAAFERTRYDVDGVTVLDPDLRYAIHPLGYWHTLRVRRAHPRDPVPFDRVPSAHFAANPGAYFDQAGDDNSRFSIRLSGLPAAVAAPVRELRQPSKSPADASLVTGIAEVTLVEESPDRRPTAAVAVELLAVPADESGMPLPASARVRGGVLMPVQGGSAALGTTPDLEPVPMPVAMLRLRTTTAGAVAHFPGATLELASTALDARHASRVMGLDVEGFLRGSLLVELPRTWVHGQRWFYVAADGSLYDAQSAAEAQKSGGVPDVPLVMGAGGLALPVRVLTVGPGPAWPPLPRTSAAERMTRVPGAPGRGPVFLHGGRVRSRHIESLQAVSGSPVMGLAFAARIARGGGAVYHPFSRLRWTGDDPSTSGAWDVLDSNGNPITSEARRAERLRDIAREREANASEIELVVRFEAEAEGLVLPPCEVAYTSDDGQTLLIHLPTLETSTSVSSDWAPSAGNWSTRSAPVSVGADGSTRRVDMNTTVRQALGAVAPLTTATLRRRRVRYRNLCGWDREPTTEPPRTLAPTPRGCLDIDPEHGLFALAKQEPPRPWPLLGGGFRPSAVTVDYLEGYTDHIGARPDAREPVLGRRQPTPTRLVSASGRLHPGAPSDWHLLPRHASLGEAFAAVASVMTAAAAARAKGEDVEVKEVIQFEDSATYSAVEGLDWPLPPVGLPVELTLQAAEGQRPVLALNGPWSVPFGDQPSEPYGALTLRGLWVVPGGVRFPAAARVAVEFCTLGDLAFFAPPGINIRVDVERSLTGRLWLGDLGTLAVRDSVLDSYGQVLVVSRGTCELERVTVMGQGMAPGGIATEVNVLEATHVLFLDKVQVRDRFHGCVRFSRVAAGSTLPRRHRVVEVPVRFVSRSRNDPAHARLAPDCAREILRGAEDGSEMGAFHGTRLVQRQDALMRRLVEFTPAGLTTGIVRMD
ncbi:phage tail protein [Cystobacter ferrugineus]|uniref:Phage tail protein n=1 Tax=Cystobacter ferrugineus TaxID=83449 RepID=A0A1L9AWZ1_9BACT|nr:phage tail protein [Cystobacter ferrugineus]OJH34517.1 hypothetical protein BON30_42670 [Cystobacter ferrugineus]